MIGGAKWVSCFGSCSSRISSLGAKESSVGTLSARFSLACSRLGVSLVLLIALVTSSFSGTAYALDPASTVFSTIVGGALSQSMKYDKLVEALAGYWYAAPAAKRTKVPLVSSDELADLPSARGLADYDDLSAWYDAYTFPIFGTQGEWLIVNYATGGYVTAFDADLEQVFTDWYDWFNGEEQTGGGAELDGDYYVITPDYYTYTNQPSSDYITVNGERWYLAESAPNGNRITSITVRVNKQILVGTSEDTQLLFVVRVGDGMAYCNWFLTENPSTITYLGGNVSPEKILTVQTSGRYYYAYAGGLQQNVSIVNGALTFDINGRSSDQIGYNRLFSMGNAPHSEAYFQGLLGQLASGGTIVPDTPVQPPTPDIPEPEQPTQPVVPTLPTITGPTVNITPDSNGSTTTTTDLQPILDALRIINNNVSSILTNLQDFETWVFDTFSAYWQSVQGYVDYLGQWFSNISKQINDTQTLLLRELRKANQYLYQLVNKKQSGGGPSIDPVSQPDESWSWWEALIQQLLNALPTAVVQFLQQLSRLNGVFPFSIPWDIGFLLGLFRQSPQTPVFDLAINCSYFNWSAHIDLTAWDALALVVRRGELLAFGMTLITFTPSALKQLEVI